MQDVMMLKRDALREGIRKEKKDRLLSEKRKAMIERAKDNDHQQNESHRYKLLEMITNIRKSPPNINHDLRLIENISVLSSPILNDPDILRYLADLTVKCRNYPTECSKIQQLIGYMVFRFIETCPEMAMNNMNIIYPILYSPEIIFIHMEVARLNSEHIKQISFKLFLEALKNGNVDWIDASEAFRTYLTEKPKLPYSQAVAILDFFEARLKYDQSEEYFINFMTGTLEVTSLEFHIDYLITKESIIPNVMEKAKMVKTYQGICVILKFISNIFRGRDETSVSILMAVPTIYEYIYRQLSRENNTEKIQIWTMYAVCNFCANGPTMISILFQNNTFDILKQVYEKASHRLRFYIVYLLMIICRKGNNRFVILMHEFGILTLLIDCLLSQNDSETMSLCLLCIKLFLLASSKMDNLGMKYTKEMVMSLERTVGLRDKLEDLVTHQESRVNEDARLILESYMNESSLF